MVTTARTSNGAGTAPDTIILIHGLWMTPRSWAQWVERYSAQGYRVLAPAYPGLEVEVEALLADPTPIETLDVQAVLDHYVKIIEGLDRPPILMGHSAGGLFVQLLLDRGYGAAGVGVASAPPEGVKIVPPSQIKSTFPVLRNPANRHKAVGFTPKQFHYVFTNTMSEEESLAAYERFHIPAPGGFIWKSVLANVIPGHQDTYVNFKNDDRAPLLLISGEVDHIFPPVVGKSNLNHYKHSTAVTDYIVFPGRSHFMAGSPGWEEVADYALDWAVTHAASRVAEPVGAAAR